MNRLLLTGGSGFLGSKIAETLKDQYEITLLQRSDPGAEQRMFSFIQCDLAEQEIPAEKRNKWDLVVHAAGRAHIFGKEEPDELFHKVNGSGTRNLLNSIRHQPPKQFVYISSVAVYGAEEGEEIDESHPLRAADPYGLSKIQAEKEVLKWSEETGAPAVILRPALIAGPNPPGNLGRMMEAIQNGKYLRIGRGEAKKSIVLANDIAELISGLSGTSGIYNLSNGNSSTFCELENAIAGRFNKKIRSIPKPAALIIAGFGSAVNSIQNRFRFPLDLAAYRKITKSLTFSSEKAKKELGWSPNEVLSKLK